jgi:hypothetical protein
MATFLLGLPGQIQSQFATKEVNSTNTTFKLISKITFGLCILASILVAGTEFFGKPITCDAGSASVNQDLMHDYCWIHGTKHIPEKNKDISDCAYKKGADENKLGYYQWVVFMLVISALLFKIPHLIWKTYEGGLMKEFFSKKGLKAKLEANDENLDNLVIDFGYYKKMKGQHSAYYYVFQSCQLLNIAMLILNWWATDAFLGGNFHSYGSDVVGYYSKSDYNRQTSGERFDPMCNAFPTKVSCIIKTGSASGSGRETNAFCILAQNIINEKIYLFLWFWFVLMFVASALQFIFEIAMVAIPSFRSFVIARQTGAFISQGMKNYIERDCNHGDWFILHQIGKNTNRDLFYRFLEKLSPGKISFRKDNGDNEELLHKNHGSDENVTIPMEEFENKQNLS